VEHHYDGQRELLDFAETAKPRPVGVKPAQAVSLLAVPETVKKDHGRLETRRYHQSAELDWFADRAKRKDSSPWGWSKRSGRLAASGRWIGGII
jgi:hypothetical protein